MAPLRKNTPGSSDSSDTENELEHRDRFWREQMQEIVLENPHVHLHAVMDRETILRYESTLAMVEAIVGVGVNPFLNGPFVVSTILYTLRKPGFALLSTVVTK
jgi:hypothetical protein